MRVKTLKTAFRKAFDLTVDEQLNALPFPDGTVTHTLLADPAYLQDEEFYSFYTSQQTSAILSILRSRLPPSCRMLTDSRKSRSTPCA